MTTPQLVPESAWFKSSYSNDSGGNCVEVANLIPTHAGIALRDSKIPDGPTLTLPPDVFTAFVTHVRA
ncbi:DUF397 domain-containing protein [Streptomyces pseudovenezuelae]|uniref:DUF397 domain-containing protein n=1 Tax=Streptomyces pseudovenezuelae TaxID=67350 RepID=A0ABT6LIQ9_9ACTN|nr:DUF397 domain-containing protein [Streptomyces pseudovenezuelae]MDH6215234.1 hypothetical protein [Streptomyces pseudovenezuelae]